MERIMKMQCVLFRQRYGILIMLSVFVFAMSFIGAVNSPESKPAKPRPAWMSSTPLVLVSNHDSMPIFQRRRGGNPTWQEGDYEKENRRQHREEREDVEIGQRQRLARPQALQRLQRHLARQRLVTRMSQEEFLGTLQKSMHLRVQRIEVFVEPQRMKLLPAFLNDLGH